MKPESVIAFCAAVTLALLIGRPVVRLIIREYRFRKGLRRIPPQQREINSEVKRHLERHDSEIKELKDERTSKRH